MRELFAALDRRQWRIAARLIAPQSLDKIRDRHLGMLAAMQIHAMAARAGTGGGSMVALQHPTGDFLEQYGSVKARVFRGSPTISELASLSPEDFYVRWQEACHHAALPLRAYGALWRFFHRERKENSPVVLGAVTEGDSAYVVYRPDGYDDPWRADVITLKRVEGSWRLQHEELGGGVDPLLDGDVFLMGRAMTGPLSLLWGRAIVGSWVKWLRKAILPISDSRKGD